jgi:hypothetical protein
LALALGADKDMRAETVAPALLQFVWNI